MLKMKWNGELELSAQRWADQCVTQGSLDIQDTCRDIGNITVGQNVATIYGEAPGLTPTAMVDIWYMELSNLNATVIARYKPSTTTHYDYFTQLMWDESYLVGCGGVKFKTSRLDRNQTIYRLVCNFAPGGNRVGRAVYADGLPCSRCPFEGECDTVYTSLCKTPEKKFSSSEKAKTISYNKETILYPSNNESQSKTKTINVSVTGGIYSTTESESNEDYITLEYMTNSGEFYIPKLALTTQKPELCKDILVIDDFVELLKKKLSSDPAFKELLGTKFPIHINGESTFTTDVRMAALVSRIYSKKPSPTTTKISNSDFVNSTLLVDLVEAVIFRSAEKNIANEDSAHLTQIPSEVSPVRVQAELAEVKQNHEFTGHYFFPEDVEEGAEENSTEATETYYDTVNQPLSDIVLEIEDIRRRKTTKDFIDEILESDTVTERTELNTMLHSKSDIEKRDINNNEGKINDFNRNKRRNRSKKKKYKNERNIENIYDDVDQFANYGASPCQDEKTIYLPLKYNDLLKKLALDVKILKLNQRFHCMKNDAIKHFLTLHITIILGNVFIFCGTY